MMHLLKQMLLALVLVCALLPCGSGLPPIEHVVVMMMENHSFDNILGWLDGIGDVTGEEFNLLDPSNPNSQRYYAARGAEFCSVPDPDHSYPGTSEQVYAPNSPSSGPVTMGGFALAYSKVSSKADPQTVMNCYTPDQVPVISALAQEFLVCNRYFASLPGSTIPNRLFIHTGQSTGYDGVNRDVGPFFARSFYEDLMEHTPALSWAIHWHDWSVADFLFPLNTHVSHFHEDVGFRKFFAGLEAGTLASYTFLVPAITPYFGMTPTAQHPDYDIRPGEALIKEVYENLRASTYWNRTLFVLIYDEHGGFWDKVPPPTGVPNPCPECQGHPYEFDFDRLGVRLPAVFISPWLPKAMDTTVYDHTSVLATVRQIFNLTSPPLTPREANATTFLDKFLSEPRSDTITKLPSPPVNPPICHPPLGHLSGLAKEIAESYDAILAHENIKLTAKLRDIVTDEDAGSFMTAAARALHSRPL
eukprot:TRINITY_DN725_c0_g1_i2.p1 TRINITY_DN725_c0_g1~~TRINITY_DN725_c0_g1_i2.p1  ORF type:complete len:474 (-),score=84.37 TRINITY_DN725_c0_g1_i2:59-1480(-)